MKLRTLFASAVGLFLMASCSGNGTHLISDSAERAQVQSDFDARKASLTQGNLFTVFDQQLTDAQREALTFLYAYMPLGDIANYGGDFFLENVDYALKAREEMPWGKIVPEREFRHFVLPIRINNENLDSSRKVFFEELKDRVKGLSLHDAVIEVNHWCHEKVVYTPSDARTSSPLASVKTAYGRCGEESTFTVAALRSVGIPARQVYTPRWAHTDDNHAWVEAWVDGEWHFLGACEPEPVLDLGWFNAPASRGMLMHTKVFGRYNGPEEKMVETPRFTEINVIDNYTTSAKAGVTIVDANQKPVADARVEFKVYNYAEFYTVADKKTDAQGKTFLSAGKGDMLVWASKDGKFGYGKVSFGKDENVTIVLDKVAGEKYTVDFDIVPPPENVKLPEVTPEQRKENTRRMAQEDSIRNAYVATFVSQAQGEAFAKELGLDEKEVAKLLIASRGNHATLTSYLKEVCTSADAKEGAVDLLKKVSAKDLRDGSLEMYLDHFKNSILTDANKADFSQYVRNPRVANEMLTPYKSFFQKVVAKADADAYRNDPFKLVEWVKANITIDPNCNLQAAPMFPSSVWNTRVADVHSRNIFFVSMARALGIPARIDEVTGKVQIMKDGKPSDIDFEASEQVTAPTGKLVVAYKPIKALVDPKYYTHFTISKIDNGRINLLSYDESDIDMGGGATWNNTFRKGVTMDEGNYVMVSGMRLANGSVLTELVFFSIEPGKTTNIDLKMRESKDEIQVIGNFNSESLYKPLEGGDPVSILSTTGRGYYVVAVLGVGQEPTNHALRDIAAMAKDFEAWGRKMVLLFQNEEQYKKFRPQDFPGLPKNIVFGYDIDGAIQNQIATNMKLQSKTILPMVIIGDTFNRVVFVSQGYTIGLGEQMMKIIHKL